MQKESNQGSKIRGARIATQASRRYMNAWSEENCLARIDGSRPWKYAARCTSPWWKQTAAHHEFLVTTSSAFWTSPTRLLPRLHATVLLDGTPPMGTCTRDPYVPEDVRPDVIMVHQTSTPFHSLEAFQNAVISDIQNLVSEMEEHTMAWFHTLLEHVQRAYRHKNSVTHTTSINRRGHHWWLSRTSSLIANP